MNVLMLSLQALALAAYITGVVTLHRRGRPWSPWRTAAFVSGLLMLDIALVSVLASYDDDVFVAHIAQHLLLMMVGPPLLALGAPVTLVLQAAPRSVARRIARFLHGRLRVVGSLGVSSVAFYGAMYAYFLTPVYRYSMTHELAHEAGHVVMFSLGCLYWWPMVGVDRIPGRPGPGARAIAMAAALPVEGLLAVLIALRTDAFAEWYSATDVRAGAGVFALSALTIGAASAAVVSIQIRRKEGGSRVDRQSASRRYSRAMG